MEPPKLTTEECYLKLTAEQGLPSDVEQLDGFDLLWIGSRTAKAVIVYFHGGGFVTHAYEAHIQFQLNGFKTMKDNGQDVAIVIPAYGLCPTSPYPTQFRQAVATIQHLLLTRAPESITLSGDSAGGILSLFLLLHSQHPHPSVPSLSLSRNSHFREAFLISPAGPYKSNTASMNQQPPTDIVPAEFMENMWGIIVSTAETEKGFEMPNPWFLPRSAPEEWWRDLPVGRVSVLVGKLELLRDDILGAAGRIKKFHDKEVDIQVFEKEVHVQPLVDALMGVKEDKESTKYWKGWFASFKA